MSNDRLEGVTRTQSSLSSLSLSLLTFYRYNNIILISIVTFFSLFYSLFSRLFYLHFRMISCQLCTFFINNRKQISPARLTKSPKYENSNFNEVPKEPNSLDHQTASQEVRAHSPIPMHSEVSSPGHLTAFNGERFIDKGLCNIVSSKISNNSVSNNSSVVSHGEKQENNDDFLVFTSGSEMIGFTQHPLED